MDANLIAKNGQATGAEQEEVDSPGLFNLIDIAGDAIDWNPLEIIPGFLGWPQEWVRPRKAYSEYRILNPWRLVRTVSYLLNILVPSIPVARPDIFPPLVEDFFWEPTLILQHPDHWGRFDSFPAESWFFINGIMTNGAVANMNADYLAFLFHRPITQILKESNSIGIDLFQCALGKEWDATIEPAVVAFPPIHAALKSNKSKVVVIAHSMGTIIMSKVLELLVSKTVWYESEQVKPPPAWLENIQQSFGTRLRQPARQNRSHPGLSDFRLEDFDPLTKEEMEKLEIYCFANCANRMKFGLPGDVHSDPIPWIESFANEHDIIARLGMLSLERKEEGIDLDGVFYLKKGKWGHLLNEHYLHDIELCQKNGYHVGGAGGMEPYDEALNYLVTEEGPRLFRYINGGR